MIQKLDLNHENILAFRVDGKIEITDVKKTINSLKQELNSSSQFNLYIEILNYDGIEMEALWERVKFGIGNMGEIINNMKKLAVVTDQNWILNLAKIYNFIPKIQHQTFRLHEKEQARQWLLE